MPNLSINHLNHCISSNKSVSAHLNWIPKQKMQFSTAANVLVNLVLCVHGGTVIAIFSHVATCLNAKSIEICFSYLKDPVRVPLVKRWTYLPHNIHCYIVRSIKYGTCSRSSCFQQKSYFLGFTYQNDSPNISNSVAMEALNGMESLDAQ